MPPLLALLFGLVLIAYLVRRESQEGPRVSAAVWIPTLWLLIVGSRPVSLWFQPGVVAPIEEGSPLDRLVYTVLIIAGVFVLARRRPNVARIVRSNAFLLLFLLYEGVSIVWSDFPFIAFKRWTKALGDPVMVLILWTEMDPTRAITALLRRCGYVLITLSVVFCKYFDNLGRAFDPWGQAFYTGVTTNKNLLGYLLFAFGLFFVVELLSRWRYDHFSDRRKRVDVLIDVLFIVMIAWLQLITDSKTALLALLVGIGVTLASRFSTVKRHFGAWATIAILLFVVLEASLSISGSVTAGAGRDETFTGRTGLWETLLREPVNPVVGVGYGSFWLGERLQRFWAMYPASPPTEAHNGYLEVYLNLGLLGLCLLAGLLSAGLWRMRARISSSSRDTLNRETIRLFGLAYGIAYLFYNITEATFQGLNFLFVIFLIVAFHYAETRSSAQPRVLLSTVRARPSDRNDRPYSNSRFFDRPSAPSHTKTLRNRRRSGCR